MKKRIIYISALIVTCLLPVFYFNFIYTRNDVASAENTSVKNIGQNAKDIFLDESIYREMGAYSFGIISSDPKMQVYEYNEKEMHIPFRVSGMNEKNNSDFGLMVFVDGVLQPYKIADVNGETGEEQTMQKFSLANEETKEFNIILPPVTGKAGDRIGINFCTIFKPDFMPQDEKKPLYGNYHQLSSTIPQEIYFKTDALNPKAINNYTNAVFMNISQEIIDKDKASGGSGDFSDSYPRAQLLQENEDLNRLNAQEGKVKFKLQIYGGGETTYRFSLFLNNKPIQIMGCDVIDITTQRNKMAVAELELETSEFAELSTLYAVGIPCGKDYLSSNNLPIKTSSVLLVNK